MRQHYPDPVVRTYVNQEGNTLTAAFGQDGEAVLNRLGYYLKGGSMSDQAPKKRKVQGLSNEEKQGLAATLQKSLKELRPDLTVQDMAKVASTFYVSILKQKKESADTK